MNKAVAPQRFAWAVTGSGHFLEESLALAARLPDVDLYLSAAAEEVLPMYGRRLDDFRPQFRVFRDKTASSVPVGALYEEGYHTVVVAPATSNTVAKCAFGISDTLPTNMFAQGPAGSGRGVLSEPEDAAVEQPSARLHRRGHHRRGQVPVLQHAVQAEGRRNAARGALSAALSR